MTIISISLSDKLLQEIDDIKGGNWIFMQNQIYRTSTRMLIADNQEKKNLTGNINSILTLIHNPKAEDKVTEIKHEFEDIIKTQIHSHLKEDKCLEVFIMEGDAERMHTLTKMFQTSRKMEYVKLTTI